MMHTTPTGLVTESVEKLAEALHALGGCKRCQWAHENLWPCKSADRYRDQADTLIASGAVRPATEVRAEAWDEGYRAAMTASIGLQGRPNQGASFPADWPEHNPYRAALAEEGGGEPRCQYVSPSPWGPTQCALPEGHAGRHAYSPSENR